MTAPQPHSLPPLLPLLPLGPRWALVGLACLAMMAGYHGAPGGLVAADAEQVLGLRPDRATLSYCQRAREAYPGVPIVTSVVTAVI